MNELFNTDVELAGIAPGLRFAVAADRKDVEMFVETYKHRMKDTSWEIRLFSNLKEAWGWVSGGAEPCFE